MYVYDMKRKTLSRKKEKIIFVVRLLLLYVCYKIMTKVVKEKKIARMTEIVKRKEDQKKHRRREKMKKLSRTTKIVRACECEK